MKKTAFCLFMVAGLLSAAAREMTLSFENADAKTGLPAEWYQNRFKTFQPYGKVERIDAAFREFGKALQITSSKASTHVLNRKDIPAKVGDNFTVTFTYRAPNGKDECMIGLYGFGKKGFCEFQQKRFKPDGKGWDEQVCNFEIRKDATERIRFFICANRDTQIICSHVKVRKLNPEEVSVYSPAQNYLLWKERTKGTNLARGRKVSFVPAPRTDKFGDTPETVAQKLTDGRVFTENNLLWFSPLSVEWDWRTRTGVMIVVDLGSVKPVKKAVIRLTGGRLDRQTFPAKLEIWAGKDGKNYFQGQSMNKLNSTECDLSNWKDVYYLPEVSGTPSQIFVYPFELAVNADARYIAFRIPVCMSGGIITDELAVIQASEQARQEKSYNSLYREKKPVPLIHETVIMRPRMDKLYLAQNMYLPNTFLFDIRKKDQNQPFEYAIDFPEGVEYRNVKYWPAHCRIHKDTVRKNGRVIYHFVSKISLKAFPAVTNHGLPFYFSAEKKIPDKEKYVVFTTFCAGKKEYEYKTPLEILDMPVVPPFKRLQVLMSGGHRLHGTWPGYWEKMRKIGFNVASYCPFWESAADIGSVKKSGMSISLELSMTQRMDHLFGKKTDEFKCQVPGGRKCSFSICLAYRGQYYQKILELITETVRKYPADILLFDEEAWEPNMLNEAMKCTCCNALREKMKMSWVEYFNWAQAEYLKPFKEAAAKGAKAASRKMPVIGFYALSPIFGYSCEEGKTEFNGYSRLFPRYSDRIENSYYGRDPKGAHDQMRSVYRIIRNPHITFPWITGGAGAYREGAFYKRSSQILLEMLMNGAGGVNYYTFPKFESPLDFYYHAAAMRQIVPYEGIIMDGSLEENFTGSNGKLIYTARKLGKKILVLTGNYDAVEAAETILPLKGEILDTATGKKTQSAGSFHLKVPAGESILLIAEEK